MQLEQKCQNYNARVKMAYKIVMDYKQSCCHIK